MMRTAAFGRRGRSPLRRRPAPGVLAWLAAGFLLAASHAQAQVVIFQDGFESGTISAGGWTSSGAQTVDGVAYSGSYAARIDDTGGLQKIVDTTGFDSVSLEFAWYTYGYDSGETLSALWSLDGSSWNVIDTHASGWAFNEVTLPAGAANQPALYIAFYSNANGFYERFRIDDVAVIGAGSPTNTPPAFVEDPFFAADATENAAYSESIAGAASDPDPGDTLTYTKLGGPTWLSIAANGALSGTPGSGDLGDNSFTVQVDDGLATDQATLHVYVNEANPTNNPPVFGADPFSASNATEGVTYADSIAGSATDPDAGDVLSYFKLSGPSWLNVAADGGLSGVPGAGDVGANAFSVQVSDGNGGSDTATLQITVDAASSNPYACGPDPTVASLEAGSGPFAVSSYRPSSTPGFGAGTIWYPTNTGCQGGFAAIAVAPGFLEGESAIDWLGPRVASHGFVVITISTNSGWDSPSSRASQLMAALSTVISESNGSSPISGLVDPLRTGLSGHSMGGGGTLIATEDNPSVDAAVPLAPYNSGSNFSGIDQPTLIVACESDGIAPVYSHASPFYDSISSSVDKAFLEIDNGDHFCANSGNSQQDTLGKYIVSWFKRFLDEDTRYGPFLCGPNHEGDPDISEYRDTCPY
jgi:dienelactone hydrolase